VAADAQVVVHFAHAGEVLDQLLGAALVPAVVHGSAERDLAFIHLDLDVAGIHIRGLGQPVAHVLADPVVRSAVALRAPAGEVALAPAFRPGAAAVRASAV